jgi:hypothetical protein
MARKGKMGQYATPDHTNDCRYIMTIKLSGTSNLRYNVRPAQYNVQSSTLTVKSRQMHHKVNMGDENRDVEMPQRTR